MDHWHCNLLKIEALLFGFQPVGGVDIGRFHPDTIGEKIIHFLTDLIAILQSAGDWVESHLQHTLWNSIHRSAVTWRLLWLVGQSHQDETTWDGASDC
jgi:hypothetical protein